MVQPRDVPSSQQAILHEVHLRASLSKDHFLLPDAAHFVVTESVFTMRCSHPALHALPCIVLGTDELLPCPGASNGASAS